MNCPTMSYCLCHVSILDSCMPPPQASPTIPTLITFIPPTFPLFPITFGLGGVASYVALTPGKLYCFLSKKGGE